MYIKLTEEEKTARKEARALKRKEEKQALEIEQYTNQKRIESITISIEWKKSRTWGSNPHATAEVKYKDDTYYYERNDSFTASGCGYCKESTVLGQIFSHYLRYKLYDNDIMKKENKPYGITLSSYGNYYSQGIGTGCFTAIAKFIGGKFEKIASGKTSDVFKYTDLSD